MLYKIANVNLTHDEALFILNEYDIILTNKDFIQQKLDDLYENVVSHGEEDALFNVVQRAKMASRGLHAFGITLLKRAKGRRFRI